ncbi:MAG: murein L,D-transpeptidase, partial [Methyloligellaceae bacterium]
MRLRLSIAYGLILGSVLAGPALAVEPEAPERLITRADAVRIIVQDRLAEPFRNETDYEKAEHGALVEYYADGGKTLWVDENGLKPKARLVIEELRSAADYGLNPNDYDLPEEIVLSSSDSTPTARLAEFEFKMSHAALAYARHARGGRMAPGAISYNLDPTLDLPDPLEVMEKLATMDDPAPYLRSFNPKHPQFEALRQTLLRIRGGSSGKKRIVIPNGPLLKPGNSHKQIVLLRKRLNVPVPMKDGVPLFPADVYDTGLEVAVKAFQKSRGLNPEGIVGPSTRRALNGGGAPKNRVKTILANMERWRWVPEHEGKLNIQVNVPEFLFRVFDGDKKIHTERVVVGKVKNQTPIFSDQMEYLVFHPYWNVPNSIKREEILPHLRRGGGGGGWFSASTRPRILQAHNLFVQYRGRDIDASTIDWRTADVRRYRFYQPPGGRNVLGFVKFIFPNKHTVYMHDTPTKSLFTKTVRAYSHGCMRVRNPRELAEIILRRDRGWSSGRVGAAIQSGKNQHVNLNTPIPVNITYFTA